MKIFFSYSQKLIHRFVIMKKKSFGRYFMAKRRFLTLAAIVSFLIALLSLEPYYYYYLRFGPSVSLLLFDSFWGPGLFCVAAFAITAAFIALAYLKKLDFMLTIAVILNSAVAVVLQIMLYRFEIGVLIVMLPPVLFSVAALFIPARKKAKLPVFSVAIASVLGILWLYFLFGGLREAAIMTGLYGVLSPGIQALAAPLLLILIEGFFLLFPRKVCDICFHVFIGLLTVLAIVFLAGGDFSTVFFTYIITLLFAALYYIVSFVPACRKFLEKFNGAEEVGTQTLPAAAEAAAGADPLEALEELQKLREAGVLTEEEFAAQKNKILGGM